MQGGSPPIRSLFVQYKTLLGSAPRKVCVYDTPLLLLLLRVHTYPCSTTSCGDKHDALRGKKTAVSPRPLTSQSSLAATDVAETAIGRLHGICGEADPVTATQRSASAMIVVPP